ncbi:MAG: DUF364 domain-containing protein [Elusimicrobiota bacterium]|nr:DUF364 domain-containing protein [Elusimicrobiota bacterium]
MMEIIRKKLLQVVKKNAFSNDSVEITAKTLSSEEALGNPEHDDYPLLNGRERLMEASFQTSKGVAFSDMFGNFKSSLGEILNMELKNNFRRAIFVATANAVLRELNFVEKTRHCRSEDLTLCAGELCAFIRKNFGNPKIFLCGLQPRFAEALSAEFKIRITDMDAANLGKEFNGIKVGKTDKTDEYMNWCDLIFATGSTFVNGTAGSLIKSKKQIVFYGVTGAGPCFLLGLKRYCPRGM